VAKLVLFDCDGVLVDTETMANRELARWISEAGLPISYEACRNRFVGMSMQSVREDIRDRDGIDIGPDFAERWQAALPAVFAKGVAAVEHVAAAIAQIRARGYAICVASSGTVAKMQLTLGSAGLLDELGAVLFSASMVGRGKPAPDLFIHAASQMGYAPAQCVVIEDSRFGAQAAHAAGMACFGYVGDPLTDAEGLADAGATLFDDMRALPDLVSAMPEE